MNNSKKEENAPQEKSVQKTSINMDFITTTVGEEVTVEMTGGVEGSIDSLARLLVAMATQEEGGNLTDAIMLANNLLDLVKNTPTDETDLKKDMISIFITEGIDGINNLAMGLLGTLGKVEV